MTPAFAVWITGLPASGKSTIAQALEERLSARGIDVALLESDAVREALTPDATYSEAERDRFYRTLGYIAALLVEHGVPVIVAATANRRAYRADARDAIDQFFEVYVDTPLEICIERDPKGIYRKGQAGESATVPGLQAGYEPPEHPDLIVAGHLDSPQDAARTIVWLLERRGYLDRVPRPLVTAN